MIMARQNRSTRRKPVPVSLLQPQNSHRLAWSRTGTSAVKDGGLTAWATARSRGFNKINVVARSKRNAFLLQKPTINTIIRKYLLCVLRTVENINTFCRQIEELRHVITGGTRQQRHGFIYSVNVTPVEITAEQNNIHSRSMKGV